ncbi:MAG: hypothetical protein V4621_07980 [Pseudomonadota bacterium]
MARFETQHIEELLGEYWDIAYSEASKGESRGDDAQEVLSAINWAIEKLIAERDHWKANHADMVKRAGLLSQRDDLPVDRLPAYREMEALQRAVQAKQAEIDRLMLEFCPGEMTAEQMAEWERHQRRVPE